MSSVALPDWESLLDPALTGEVIEPGLDDEAGDLGLVLAELEKERQEEQLERQAEEALALSLMPEEEAGPSSAGFTDMSPRKGAFPSVKEALAHCQKHAKSHGYACSTASNRVDQGLAYFKCSRGGKNRNNHEITEENRRRDRITRAAGCGWKVRVKRTLGQYEVTVLEGQHTGHGPDTPVAFSSHRYIPEAAVQEVERQVRQGTKTTEILGSIREGYPDMLATDRDIYNLRARVEREELGTRSPVEALLEALAKDGIKWAYELDETGRITHLALSHPGSIELL